MYHELLIVICFAKEFPQSHLYNLTIIFMPPSGTKQPIKSCDNNSLALLVSHCHKGHNVCGLLCPKGKLSQQIHIAVLGL